MQQTRKIAVTVVTGFLGAGKTTFINFLLKKYPETRFALVENEFGDVSIDTQLIKGLNTSQLFELKQGCICCTISNEYELVLQELAERFPDVEHLLIETTGLADPSGVIRPFFRDEKLQELYNFNGTICLVDAENFNASPEQEISLKQLAVADEAVVSKSEHFQKGKREKLKNTIREINPFANIWFAASGEVEGLDLFHIFSEYDFSGIPRPAHLHTHIQSKTITWHRALNKQVFIYRFSYNLDVYKNEIFRVKGTLCFENEPYEYILQGVGGNFELTESDHFVSGNKSVLVFIGRVGDIPLDILAG